MRYERKIDSVEVLYVWELSSDNKTPLEFTGEAYRKDGTSFNCYGFLPPTAYSWSIYTIEHGHIKKYGTCPPKGIIYGSLKVS